MKKLLLSTAALSVMAFPALAEENNKMQCEPGMECSAHEKMKMGEGMMMKHGEDKTAPMAMDSTSVDEGMASVVPSGDFQWLKPTEVKYVCMVNNTVFDKVQIPTEVDGKTYYGCCEMCKAKLEGSQELREATDPVSGNVVDKAYATVGAGPDGAVYYFENEENMKAFDKSQASHSSSESDNHEQH